MNTMRPTIHGRWLTASILEAHVRKTPKVSVAHAKADASEKKLDFPVPFLPIWSFAKFHLVSHCQSRFLNAAACLARPGSRGASARAREGLGRDPEKRAQLAIPSRVSGSQEDGDRKVQGAQYDSNMHNGRSVDDAWIIRTKATFVHVMPNSADILPAGL